MQQSDYQTIEKLIQAVEKAYERPGRLYWRAFFIGICSALGATIGVALVLTLIGWLFRHLGGVPVISDWLNAVQSNIPTK